MQYGETYTPKNIKFNVTVAEMPSEISFVGLGESVTFKKEGEEEIPEKQVTCQVTHVRPAPTFQWMIGKGRRAGNYDNVIDFQVLMLSSSMTLKSMITMPAWELSLRKPILKKQIILMCLKP